MLLGGRAIIRRLTGQPVVLALVALLVVIGAVGAFGLARPGQPSSTPTTTPTGLAAASAEPAASPTGAAVAPTSTSPTASPTPGATIAPTSSPTPTPTPTLHRFRLPLVPVVSFWSGATSISRAQLERAVAGTDDQYDLVVVPTGTGEAVRAELPGASLEERDQDGLLRALRNGALGLVPLTMVDHRLRALAVDGQALFGNRRGPLADWPLEVDVELAEFDWDQARTWTLVAAGDILLDRGVARQTTVLGKGADFPWDGGTVAIQRRRCCTAFGWPYPISRRTGNEGALRALFAEADLSMANLESAVFPGATYHTTGFAFTGDPRLLRGLTNAGVDLVTLANNHIGNGGRQNILRTMEMLDERGIAHAGAGPDLAAAARPTIVQAGGQRVAIISCTSIGGFRAAEDRIGVHSCGRGTTTEMVRRARAEADVVIVSPHWGAEYRLGPAPNQRRLAQMWVEAGADLVIGHHSHWAGAIEEIGDGLAFYSLGNFIFDQTWSENTMEGLVLELTFQGDRLVQAWLHPTLILDAAQPNLLEYERGGRDVLERVRDGSRSLFDY